MNLREFFIREATPFGPTPADNPNPMGSPAAAHQKSSLGPMQMKRLEAVTDQLQDFVQDQIDATDPLAKIINAFLTQVAPYVETTP